MINTFGQSRRRLRYSFAVLACVVVLVVVGGAGVLVWQQRDAVLAETAAAHRGTARALSRHVFHVVRSSEVLLDQMLAEVRREGGVEAMRANSEPIHRHLLTLVRPLSEINTALIADGDGRLVASNFFQPVPDIRYTDRAWFRAHQAGQDFVIGEPVVGRNTGALIITISRAQRDAQGRIVAIALVGVEISYIENLFAETHTDDGRAAALFRDDGVLIARNPPALAGTRYPQADVLRLSRSQPSGTFLAERAVVDGEQRLVAYDRVGDYPLLVVVGQTLDKVLAPWRAVVVKVALLLVGVLAALGLAARHALEGIRREETALATAEAARHEAEASAEALRQANERLSLVLDAAPEGIFGVDADDRAIFVNDAAMAMLGFERHEMEGARLHDLIHHHHADGTPYPAAACAISTGLQAARLCSVADEVFWRKDGSSFPVDYTAGRLDLADGSRGAVVVFRDISTRRRMEDELKRSNADLEQFAYAVSHDLQEPLRTISGFVSLLKRGYRAQLPDEAVEFIDLAVDGVVRMSGMIDDLLAYSRIGRTEMPPTPVDLGQCAEAARDALAAAIDTAGATVEIGRLPTVHAIPGQMVSLFQNLLGNAIKYAAPGRPPQVTMAARREGGDWVIRIADNGMGIDKEYREKVFLVFQRLHHRGISGSGVGLALCRRIAERHRGAIWVEDRDDGQPGSVFAVRLPAI